jgi:hypothetical protein
MESRIIFNWFFEVFTPELRKICKIRCESGDYITFNAILREEIVISPITVQKSNSLICFVFSLLAFGVAFGISYQQDLIRVQEVGQLAWLHLVYAEELKDDMAIIDWSKNLQKINGVLAFQATNDSKVAAEGGNRSFLPVSAKEGVSYSFPAKWVFHIEMTTAEKKDKGLTLVYYVWPGPLQWGLFTFLFCFITGIGATVLPAYFSPAKIQQPLLSPIVPKPVGVASLVRPQNSSSRDKPFVFLDKNYVIQQVSPEAAKLLQRNTTDLMNGHLFDLDPEPSLMQAIEKAEDAKLLKPFLSHPKLSAILKPDPNGTILFLESTE